MTEFSRTSAFQLVRMIGAAGFDTPAVYLLLGELDKFGLVREDIETELKVQLGVSLQVIVSTLVPLEELRERFDSIIDGVTLLTIDKAAAELVRWLDRNVILVSRTGVLLLFAAPEAGERLLSQAPNLRSRLTDVFQIRPEGWR